MPYAEGRIYNDADSHFMETKDWLLRYADPESRAPNWLRSIFRCAAAQATEDLVTALPGIIGEAQKRSRRDGAGRGQSPGAQELACAGRISTPTSAASALDLLGYNRQLVFTGMASTQFWGGMGLQRYFDPEILYGGARAYNRAIADFCSHDPRLRAVGFVPLDVPGTGGARIKAGRCAMAARRSGFRRRRRPRCRRPIPTWTWSGRRLQELDLPFICHLGGGQIFCARAFLKNGKQIEAGPLAAGPTKSAPRTTWCPLRHRSVPVRDDSGRRAGESSPGCAAA